ncbi:MAG: ELWxxDGT repeat protein [Chitinophagales bacterium]
MKYFLPALLLFASALPAQTLVEVKDILPGAANSLPNSFTFYNGYTYFQATDSTHGTELWRTDGTTAGTQLFIDIVPGKNSSSPSQLYVVNNKLVFWADDQIHGAELWATDGTVAGTILIKDINPGNATSHSQNNYGTFLQFQNRLYFTPLDSVHGTEVWYTDGTAANTALLRDIARQNESSFPYLSLIVPAGNAFYFTATDSAYGNEIWISDGTTSGTHVALDLMPGLVSSYPSVFCNYRGKTYFSYYGANGNELYGTDGTLANTALVKDINLAGDGFPIPVTVVNDRLVFTADDGVHDRELWSSDGTAANTKMIADIDSSTIAAAGSTPGRFCVNGNYLYFVAYDSAHGYEPYITDGTDTGTRMIMDVRPGPSSSIAGWAEGFLAAGNKVFFKASTDADGTEFWESDGTAANTKMVLPQFVPGPGHGDPIDYRLCNTSIYMQGKNSTDGFELWKIDGVVSGLTEIAATRMQVFPNPCSKMLTIAGADEAASIQLFDVSGRLLRVETGATIGVDGLDNGLYLVRVTSHGETHAAEVVVSK